MPTKPKKVQGAGVAVFADGGILSRLQSVTADTDLGVEEIREISNSSVVEFVEGTPTVSVQMEANQVGKRHNIAYLTGQDGEKISAMIGTPSTVSTEEITHFSFNGTQTDLVMQVEEDAVLARSIYMPDCFLTALSWNFDVGGVATESYSLESDDKRMFVGSKKELVVVSGYYTGADQAGTSGFYITVHPDLEASDYVYASGFNTDGVIPAASWSTIEASVDGAILKNTTTGATIVPDTGDLMDDVFARIPSQFASQVAAGRIRMLGYKDTANTAITADTTLATADFQGGSNIGGIRKGMVQIFLISGAPWEYESRTTDAEEFLRLQTCSIDVDLSREALEELGNPEAYERSLNFPISATVNFSTLASDIQAWAGFANMREEYDAEWGNTVQEIGFRSFVQQAGVLIKIFDDDETNASRRHLMTLTVSGVRVASESFSVDAGGNAVQEFSCSADNFVIS